MGRFKLGLIFLVFLPSCIAFKPFAARKLNKILDRHPDLIDTSIQVDTIRDTLHFTIPPLKISFENEIIRPVLTLDFFEVRDTGSAGEIVSTKIDIEEKEGKRKFGINTTVEIPEKKIDFPYEYEREKKVIVLIKRIDKVMPIWAKITLILLGLSTIILLIAYLAKSSKENKKPP